ncbi:MAG TPA: hypothetical protein VGE00_07840 [Gammaproteobacteria bacterium]
MGRHTFLTVLLFTALILAVAIFLPSGREPAAGRGDYPWNVTVDSEGFSTVFGISVGRSTVRQAAELIRDPAELSMFVASDGKQAVEVYFDRVAIGEIYAKVVLGVALDAATLQGMYERGVRISNLGGGVRKVELHPDDRARVSDAMIASLTYIPSVNLNAEVIRKRFGEPARLLKERDSGLVHWLYPAIGLDLAVNDEGKEVLLYVKPTEFGRVTAPLQEMTEEIVIR